MFNLDHKIRLKIKGFPSEREYNNLPFGRRIDFNSKLREFKDSAKTGHLGTERRSVAQALKEFKDLYDVEEYYFVDRQSDTWHDDSIEIYYKSKI